MTDQTSGTTNPEAAPVAPPAAPTPDAGATAATALLAQDVAGLKTQVKRLWTTVIAMGVVVVLLACASLVLPRILGARLMGGPAGFRPGMQGQQFPGGGQGFRGSGQGQGDRLQGAPGGQGFQPGQGQPGQGQLGQ